MQALLFVLLVLHHGVFVHEAEWRGLEGNFRMESGVYVAEIFEVGTLAFLAAWSCRSCLCLELI